MDRDRTLFLIVDMQNGFINNYTKDLVGKIYDFQSRIKDRVITAGTRYVNHEHTACYVFEGWKSCMAGSEEAEIVPELRPLPGEMVIVKPRYSAFFHTRLDLCLRRLGVDALLIAGTQYPNCIRATVTDALSLDYRVTVLSDCCSAQTPEIAEANLTDMRNLGARCVTLAAWRAGAEA